MSDLTPRPRASRLADPGMRLCVACGGSGLNDQWQGGDLVERFELCLACGGDGQFLVAMPAKDALADAETLRRCTWDFPIAFDLIEAHAAADPDVWKSTATAYLQARLVAAPAAFRACPGLRGDA